MLGSRRIRRLQNKPYLDQKRLWPTSGRHILAQFDENAVVVYRAYRAAIGKFTAEQGYF